MGAGPNADAEVVNGPDAASVNLIFKEQKRLCLLFRRNVGMWIRVLCAGRTI